MWSTATATFAAASNVIRFCCVWFICLFFFCPFSLFTFERVNSVTASLGGWGGEPVPRVLVERLCVVFFACFFVLTVASSHPSGAYQYPFLSSII